MVLPQVAAAAVALQPRSEVQLISAVPTACCPLQPTQQRLPAALARGLPPGPEALPIARQLVSAVWSRAEAALPACAAVCRRAHPSGGAGQTLGVCLAVVLPPPAPPTRRPTTAGGGVVLEKTPCNDPGQDGTPAAGQACSQGVEPPLQGGQLSWEHAGLAWPASCATRAAVRPCSMYAGRLLASVQTALSSVSGNRCRSATDDHALHGSGVPFQAGHVTDLLCGLQAASPDLRHATSGGVSPVPDRAPQTEAPLLCWLQVGPDLCKDAGAIHAAIRAYRPHLARCTNPTAAASGHPARSAPATAAAPSCRTPPPEQDAGPPPGLQSERGSLDEPSFSAAAGHAAGQRPQELHSSARVNLDSHFDAAAADAAGRAQQAPLTPVEPESEDPPPTSSAGSSPRHGTSQLEVQRKSPFPPTPTPTCPAVPTNGAAQAQAETPAITALTDGPAKRSAGGQAAACPPGPEPGTSQPRKGRARRW